MLRVGHFIILDLYMPSFVFILFVSLFYSILSEFSQIHPSPYPQKATILMCLCLFGVGLADITQYSQSDLNFTYTIKNFLVHLKYMAQTYTKKLFIIYLKFKFNSLLNSYLPTLTTTVWYNMYNMCLLSCRMYLSIF